MKKTKISITFFVFAVGLAGVALAQSQPDRSSDQPPRDEPARRREQRPNDDGPPPPGKARPKGDGGDKRGPFYDGGYAPRPAGIPQQGFGSEGAPMTGEFGRGMRGGMMPGPGFMRGGAMPGMGGMPGMSGAYGEQSPDDPEMREILRQDMEMEHKTHELAVRIRESRGDERTKQKAELSELVNKHFDVRQKRRELQLKRMEDELQRLREAISSRNKSRESIVTNHMKELIGEQRDLEF